MLFIRPVLFQINMDTQNDLFGFLCFSVFLHLRDILQRAGALSITINCALRVFAITATLTIELNNPPV